MSVQKLSISVTPDLGDAIRSAAVRSGRGLSGWIADAAHAQLRAEAFVEFLSEWEKEHGAITEDELVQAAADLNLPNPFVDTSNS